MDELVSSPVSPRTSNALLRQVVVIATILSLATAYGWMASFDRQPGGDMASHWSWATAIWVWSARRAAFSSGARSGRPRIARRPLAAKSSPVPWFCCCRPMVADFSLVVFITPNFRDVGTGLVAAAMVLTFGAWMVTRLIKAFESSDTRTWPMKNPGIPRNQSPAPPTI